MFDSQRVHLIRLAWLAALAPAIACTHKVRPVQVTTAEASRFTRTGNYDEARAICTQIADNFPNQARCFDFGTTTQGRAMIALAVSTDGTLTAPAVAAKQRPVIMIQAGIHAGEIEGKDAGFAFLLAMLRKQLPADALRAATWVFIPVLNPDGHERISLNNRPNQRGPVEMGFRTTGVNLNLNRDYMKVDSVELRAELALIAAWHPTMLVDLHTTDGAKFQHDVAVLVAPSVPRPDGLTTTAKSISDKLQTRLTALSHLPVPFYPSFREQDHPESGIEAGDPPARFSHGYAAERGMFGILVETHSWRTYQERVKATYDTLQALSEQVATDVSNWHSAQARAEAAQAALAGQTINLLFDITETSRPIAFQGYQITREPSTISNAPWTHYDEQKPEVWTIPLFDQFKPAITVTAPAKGYIIDGGYAALVEPVLRAHGITYHATSPTTPVAVQTFRADTAKFGDKSYEARQRLTITGAWHDETRTLAPGALWIPIAQPLARVIVGLCEPTAPDALVNWGIFNAAFEQKEYMEDYVAEQVARDMLAANPQLQTEFDAKLAADPAFAKSSEARLDFFRRKHPSWDERFNLLPIYRVER